MTQYNKNTYFRETFKWGSFGINGDEPLKWRLLKEISDSHLINIGHHVRNNIVHFGRIVLGIILHEQSYRRVNNIIVKEY